MTACCLLFGKKSLPAFTWGRAQQIPAPFKVYQSVPIFPISQIKEASCQEQRGPGSDRRRGRSGACRPAPPSPGSPSSDLRAAPIKPAPPRTEIAPPLSPGPVHAIKPHGQPCLFICDDQSGRCRRRSKHPFHACVLRCRVHAVPWAHLSPGSLHPVRGAQSRGFRAPAPPRQSRESGYQECGATSQGLGEGRKDCGKTGWRNQKPRRRKTGFLF